MTVCLQDFHWGGQFLQNHNRWSCEIRFTQNVSLIVVASVWLFSGVMHHMSHVTYHIVTLSHSQLDFHNSEPLVMDCLQDLMLIWKYNPLMGLALSNILFFPLPSPLSLSLWFSKWLLQSSSLSSWFLCPSLTWPTWGGSGPVDTCVRAAAHGVGLKFWHLHNHWRSSQVGNMVGAFILSGRWSLALWSWFPIWSSVSATSTLSASFETPGKI